MTTIVKHRRTKNEYILLGINGEANQTNPSRFISELFNQEKSEVSCSATVCDAEGNIFLAYIDDLVVVEIDGQKPDEILPKPSYESASNSVGNSASNSVSNSDVVRPSPAEFENDEELEDDDFDDEDFDDEQDPPVARTTSEASFLEGLGSPIKSKDEDDDDDWV